ncbi:MAG: leukotriene A4 hydrolase C-terminal domain-containing protein [Gammaproteobacteria bacterium]
MKRFVAAMLFIAPGVAMAAADPHSYAEPDKFLVRHVALDLTADFEARRLEGIAELAVERLDPYAKELVLDTRDLEIKTIHLIEPSGRALALAFELGERDPILGSPLAISFAKCCVTTSEMQVRIAYRTSPEATALQWLEPAQTSSPHPFLYSQGQSIHTRSWIPLQDTPGVRVTYSARIVTPPGLVAVMSAARKERQDDAPNEFRFEMKQPIPSYLIALAIGDLEFRSLGDRTGVWTEPSRLEAAAREFTDLPRMVEAGERLAGPYRWERYDLLIMPRAFAYGGMENPRLSFISPSVVAGDRSLVSLIVHELAHSWSGNLVTNATWNDFWLNEGFTTYLERRLTESLYGERRARMEDAIGYESLKQAIEDAGASGRPQDSALKLELAGRDPDEGVSDVAYEKGRWFLGFLETRFGRPAFDAFLREYFDAHAFQSITTEGFRARLLAHLEKPGAPAITVAEIDAWLHGPGLPATMPEVPQGVFDGVDRAAAEWRAGRMTVAQLPVKDWVPQEWVRFLDGQPAELEDAKLAELRRQFKLGAAGNAEIALAWLRLVVKTSYEPGYPDLERFLTSTGRYKLVVTLFRDLARSEESLTLGRDIYAKARPGYHATIRQAVERLLWPEPQPAAAAPAAVALTELLNQFLAGVSRNEIAAHERFWADDLIYTRSAGMRIGKAEILEAARTGPHAADAVPTRYHAEDIRIQQYGDAAVVAFRLVGTMGSGDEAVVMNFLNTGTFVKREGEWRAVAWQSTRVPEPAKETNP